MLRRRRPRLTEPARRRSRRRGGAPASRSARAQASSVAPVVRTSSTSRQRAGAGPAATIVSAPPRSRAARPAPRWWAPRPPARRARATTGCPVRAAIAPGERVGVVVAAAAAASGVRGTGTIVAPRVEEAGGQRVHDVRRHQRRDARAPAELQRVDEVARRAGEASGVAQARRARRGAGACRPPSGEPRQRRPRTRSRARDAGVHRRRGTTSRPAGRAGRAAGAARGRACARAGTRRHHRSATIHARDCALFVDASSAPPPTCRGRSTPGRSCSSSCSAGCTCRAGGACAATTAPPPRRSGGCSPT